jgi:transposase
MQESIYCGIDLHSSNLYIGIVDNSGKRLYQKRIRNDLELLLKILAPYSDKLQAIAVESTFNWYWLVDGLMNNGYNVKLANPHAIQQYSGLKHTDDKSDAFWLAEQLRLDILPTVDWQLFAPPMCIRRVLTIKIHTQA